MLDDHLSLRYSAWNAGMEEDEIDRQFQCEIGKVLFLFVLRIHIQHYSNSSVRIAI